MNRDDLSCGFIEYAVKSEEGSALPEENLQALRADADALGFFGLLGSAACLEGSHVDGSVVAELATAIDRDLKDALGETDEVELAVRFQRFEDAKGERGPELLLRLITRVIYELYDLRAHGLMQDDAMHACELLAWGGPGQDARETAKRVLRLSRKGARATLGHLDSQLDLVHRLANPEAPILYSDLDRRLHEFAPRIFAQRLPSLAKYLINEDKRFRFCFVLWARLRGIVLGRAGLVEMSQRIEPSRPMLLIQALEEASATRTAFRQACEAYPLGALIEAACRARPLPAPE